MIGRRTKIDFSNHEVIITQFNGISIHTLKKIGTNQDIIIYLNACNVLSITGDYGNWIFCREFHPSPNGRVDSGYWDQKLEIASVQKAKAFDSDLTLSEIERVRKEYNSPDVLKWLDKLKCNVDDEFDYKTIAYREIPNEVDYLDIPYGKKRHYWLDAVYDGFEALCTKLKYYEI